MERLESILEGVDDDGCVDTMRRWMSALVVCVVWMMVESTDRQTIAKPVVDPFLFNEMSAVWEKKGEKGPCCRMLCGGRMVLVWHSVWVSRQRVWWKFGGRWSREGELWNKSEAGNVPVKSRF